MLKLKEFFGFAIPFPQRLRTEMRRRYVLRLSHRTTKTIVTAEKEIARANKLLNEGPLRQVVLNRQRRNYRKEITGKKS